MHRFCCWHFSCMLTLSHLKIDDLFTGVYFVLLPRTYTSIFMRRDFMALKVAKTHLIDSRLSQNWKKQKARNNTSTTTTTTATTKMTTTHTVSQSQTLHCSIGMHNINTVNMLCIYCGIRYAHPVFKRPNVCITHHSISSKKQQSLRKYPNHVLYSRSVCMLLFFFCCVCMSRCVYFTKPCASFESLFAKFSSVSELLIWFSGSHQS